MLYRRLAQAVPVAVGVSVLTFLLLNVLPGNVALAILGPGADPAAVKALQVQDGLNHPLWVRYWRWLSQAVQGNLGNSFVTHQSVSSLIMVALPVTVELIVVAEIVSLLLVVPGALLSAALRGGWLDRLLSVFSFGAISVPPFLLGFVLILLLSVDFHVFPATGWVSLTQDPVGNLRSAILPAASLGIGEFGFHLRILRGDVLEQLQEDYVVTARAKGVSRWQILTKHVLRNSVFVLITAVGVNFGRLLSGAVVVELLFALPGVGSLLVDSIYQRDVTVVEGVVVFVAIAFVVINLAVDLLYVALDPRLRKASGRG